MKMGMTLMWMRRMGARRGERKSMDGGSRSVVKLFGWLSIGVASICWFGMCLERGVWDSFELGWGMSIMVHDQYMSLQACIYHVVTCRRLHLPTSTNVNYIIQSSCRLYAFLIP